MIRQQPATDLAQEVEILKSLYEYAIPFYREDGMEVVVEVQNKGSRSKFIAMESTGRSAGIPQKRRTDDIVWTEDPR